MLRPNLFAYATSELSQDAALCWLLAWAHPNYASEDAALHQLAQQFIYLSFSKAGKDGPPTIDTLAIQRQADRIDVLVTINDAWWLLIEDKVGTQEHSRQLETYLEKLMQRGNPPENIAAVYVQTGEQSSYDNVYRAGFQVVTRLELLALLTDALTAGSSNAILVDFQLHLIKLEQQYQAYHTAPLNEWNGRAWQGFFSTLKLRLGTGDWDYVPTASGGFQGFWWNWLFDDQSEAYLQLEHGRLCFKLGDFDANMSSRVEYARSFNARVVAAGKELGVPITKPGRYQSGETMTAAIFPADYRVADVNGVLDLEATLKQLMKAQQVLHKVFGLGPE